LKEQLEQTQKALTEKESEIERVIQENEQELTMTKEALEHKSKELKALKIVASGNEAVVRRLEQVEEEKQMFQMQLLALTDAVQEKEKQHQQSLSEMNDLVEREVNLKKLLEEKEKQNQTKDEAMAQLLKEKDDIVDEISTLKENITLQEEHLAQEKKFSQVPSC
jgi:chromosome segregation ATPase